ncbi:cupin domain-containing protein [Methylobacterium organophilum]|uniref:cupin domain-containing protein n=1 Tax=Methylobacterium organophilum TaxID=410 RepID=UPI001F135EC4|nr:cupin domain-containing protein [Methylobacterium organophilum]UMY18625.1 cupin domain-containing protein [Methylobacterium organophilum]
MAIRVFHRDTPSLRLPLISKDARFVVWPGVGAWTANMNYVRLEPGEENVPHIHVQSEDTIFILEGEGTIQDYTNDVSLPFHAGCAVHVPVGVKHAVKADRGVGIVSVGGPSPADVALLVKAGALPQGTQAPERS